MFTKILFPTDFSECADKVIPYLINFKKSGTREVVIVHVIDVRYNTCIDTLSVYGESMQNVGVELYSRLVGDAKKHMEKLKKKLSKYFKVKTIIEDGMPFKTIIDTSVKEKATLIMIGSHGKSNIVEMLLGSVSEKVVRKSPIPCLVIKR